MPPGPGVPVPAELPASEYVLGGCFVALLHLGASLALIDGSTVVVAPVSAVAAALRLAAGGILHRRPTRHPAPECRRQAKLPASGHCHSGPGVRQRP
ncbi:hypothetical protein [Streptomyces shenzhenensis]|uniref:hypothetical protein n=1 Tax=Streptomyces shenzhenensis TaxID=943815 RepID=UPI0033D0BAB4